MRPLLCCALLLIASSARAISVASDLSIGPGFLWRASNVEGELLDGRLGLGGGYTMVSDFHDVRFGAQALVAAHGERWSAQLAGSWGPKQGGRGWATLAPSGSLHFAWTRLALDGEVELTLRRADAAMGRAITPIDQLQARAQLGLAIDERWRAEAWGVVSFYDPDLSRWPFNIADAGLLVTMAGRPERWAVGVRGGRNIGRTVGVELGFAWRRSRTRPFERGRGADSPSRLRWTS